MLPRLEGPIFNPSDELQMQKPSYLKTLPLLNESQVDYVDWSHRSRLQALKGVDELVEDVLNLLESSGTLDNTFGEKILCIFSKHC